MPTRYLRLPNEKAELKAWSELLAVLSQTVADPAMQSIIASPSVNEEQVLGLMADIAGEAMTDDATSFLALLAEQ